MCEGSCSEHDGDQSIRPLRQLQNRAGLTHGRGTRGQFLAHQIAVQHRLMQAAVCRGIGSRDRGALVMGVPITNHDHDQHAANEIRLTNLWDAITVYAAMFAVFRPVHRGR
jgi:hypothetical protein